MKFSSDKKHDTCVLGDQCNINKKTIGLTINDILQNQIQSHIPLKNQSSLVITSIALTMIMFLCGFINGIFSLMTFQNQESRKVGCGMYLFASSITTLLTSTMFTVKFWFVVLIQLYSTVNLAIHRADCLFIGPFLKLCLYLDGWLNTCVAIERTINVFKGVGFNKDRSKHVARRVITILPILIFVTIIHEPVNYSWISYDIPKYKFVMGNSIEHDNAKNGSFVYTTEYRVLCIIRYSRSVQTYNTFVLFFHLVAPFVANLLSALYIIFGTAGQRSVARSKLNYRQYVLKQMQEHRQLLISPIILLVLALPRIIISLISECVDPSSNPWLYLIGYFISFMPPILTFIVFVLPSKLYRKIFKEAMMKFRK